MSGLRAYLHNERRWVELPEGELVVGRDGSCGCQVNDDTVSGRHLRLIVRRGEVEVEDLESTNGTRINGEPIGAEVARLSPGDRLQCGRVVFVIEAGALRAVLAFVTRLLSPARFQRGPRDSRAAA
jgi:pSer/pThr/pTyr-binding forkhead associated (FHA) protein